MSAERKLDGSRLAPSFRGLSRPGAGWHSTTTLWHTGFLSHCVIEGAVFNVPLTVERPDPPTDEGETDTPKKDDE